MAGIPIAFLTRFAVPMIVAALSLQGNAPEQASLYSRVSEESDHVLSTANREGEGPTETYDFIIIGAGSAGAVLANRLSSNNSISVLVLDVGGDPSPIVEVPILTEHRSSAGMMLDYMSVRQGNACLSNGGICGFQKGKALGGTSSVNSMIYHRGNPRDYDKWAEFTGDNIWRFDNQVVKAFKAIETYEGAHAENRSANHGTNGEIHVESVDYNPGYEVLVEALLENNVPVGDLNSGEFPWGFSKVDYNMKDGLRMGTYQAFLHPILERTNLKIYRYAQVTRIVLDGNNRAIGVIYRRHGESRYVAANREVILSAGVVDSPKLLMLSGIGNREHLQSLGIPTIIDLPAVGNYLQEHVGVKLYPMSINQTFGTAYPITPSTINEYIQNASGPVYAIKTDPVGNPEGIQGYRILQGNYPSKSKNNSNWPDLHCYLDTALTQEGEQLLWADVEAVLTDQTGTLRLASANPDDPPLIDPRFLEDPSDVERLLEGIEYILDILLNSTTLKRLGIDWSQSFQRIPACEQFYFPSREYWRCYIPQMSVSKYHATSTCRMGPNSQLGVVDSRLRVFNTTGLRIIDSSVIPFVPNGNTNFPSIMVGEMGARIILNEFS